MGFQGLGAAGGAILDRAKYSLLHATSRPWTRSSALLTMASLDWYNINNLQDCSRLGSVWETEPNVVLCKPYRIYHHTISSLPSSRTTRLHVPHHPSHGLSRLPNDGLHLIFFRVRRATAFRLKTTYRR